MTRTTGDGFNSVSARAASRQGDSLKIALFLAFESLGISNGFHLMQTGEIYCEATLQGCEKYYIPHEK